MCARLAVVLRNRREATVSCCQRKTTWATGRTSAHLAEAVAVVLVAGVGERDAGAVGRVGARAVVRAPADAEHGLGSAAGLADDEGGVGLRELRVGVRDLHAFAAARVFDADGGLSPRVRIGCHVLRAPSLLNDRSSQKLSNGRAAYLVLELDLAVREERDLKVVSAAIVCNGDAFRVSETDSKQTEKASLDLVYTRSSSTARRTSSAARRRGSPGGRRCNMARRSTRP